MAQAHEARPPGPADLTPAPTPRPRVLEADQVRLDLGAMLLRVDGRRVELTVQEFALLKVLMESEGRVLRREELLDQAWGPDRGRMSNTLSVVMSRVRHKLLRLDGTSRIRTVRTVGYAFDAEGPLDQ